jgi:hypothetical protein
MARHRHRQVVQGLRRRKARRIVAARVVEAKNFHTSNFRGSLVSTLGAQ